MRVSAFDSSLVSSDTGVEDKSFPVEIIALEIYTTHIGIRLELCPFITNK